MEEKKEESTAGALVSMLNLLANGSHAEGDECALARSVLLSRISCCKQLRGVQENDCLDEDGKRHHGGMRQDIPFIEGGAGWTMSQGKASMSLWQSRPAGCWSDCCSA